MSPLLPTERARAQAVLTPSRKCDLEDSAALSDGCRLIVQQNEDVLLWDGRLAFRFSRPLFLQPLPQLLGILRGSFFLVFAQTRTPAPKYHPRHNDDQPCEQHRHCGGSMHGVSKHRSLRLFQLELLNMKSATASATGMPEIKHSASRRVRLLRYPELRGSGLHS